MKNNTLSAELLHKMDHCLRSRHYVNVVVAGKYPAPQWLTMEAAVKHCSESIGIWRWPMVVCASFYPLSGCNAGCGGVAMADWPNYQAGYGRLYARAAVRMADTIFADGLEYGLSEVRFSSGLLQERKA